MNYDMFFKRFLSLVLLFVTGWLTFVGVQGEPQFINAQPIKAFSVIQKEVFCPDPKEKSKEKNESRAQCSQMNENYLKFYFSVFMSIAWGGAVRTVIKTFELSIPYTVVLLLTGLIIGLGSRVNVDFCVTWSMFTRFARTPPELILYVFLPILIFESAFSMKAHVFMRSFLSISVVALPGMLITTFVTAIASQQFMENYNWSFSEASLFGAIISATDPVAVVAILRELGTSEMLSVMIEGESLLNDGVAILLYEVFKEIVEAPKGDESLTLKVTWQFIRIAIGGPTFGFAMGKLSIYCLSAIFNDAATEITITLVSAYLTYFIAEFYLSVSGVMAVVLLGVTISAESTCISPEVEHVVHQFWQMMSFLANTVLFVILGVVISETAINSFEIRDGYNVIWLYVALNIVRLMMLLLLSPILSRFGYGITWRNLTVMMWGGLRGAVGICLALEVYKNKKLCKFETIGPKFLLQTAGIVILTLMINGTTTKSLLDYLGVTTISIGKLQDMANAVKTITSARVRTITVLKHDRFLADANWEVVHRFTHLKDPYAKKHKAHDDRAKKLLEQKLQRLHRAPGKLNEKLITGGHLSSAKIQDKSNKLKQKSHSASTLPVINVQGGNSVLMIHQGKVKVDVSTMGIDGTTPELDFEMEVEEKQETKEDMEDEKKEKPLSEFKAMMEESRLRVLKAMKISCWRQYERGSLSEEAVKLVVGAIEAKEDVLLSMIHVEDLRDNWAIKGVIAWIRKHVYGFLYGDNQPVAPAAKWRHSFFWLACRPWFHGIIYFIIFLNLGPIIYETKLLIEGKQPEGDGETFLFISTVVFTMLYTVEFLIKVIGRGVTDYFSSKWNLLDFFVLIVSICEMILAILKTQTIDVIGQYESGKNGIAYLKTIRFVRFVRLLRWFRPLMPLLNRFLESRLNARLFMGYDVGKGFVQALEDALRFLPQMVDNRRIERKFENVLDADRLKTVKELGLLQLEHPGVVVAVKTRHASRSISNQMREDLEDLRIDGLLDDKEFVLLISKIEGNLKKLWASPASVKPVEPHQMLNHISWVVGNEAILAFIKDHRKVIKHEAGDIIYSIGDPSNGIHMIISGLVKLEYQPTEEIIKEKLDRGILPNTEFLLDLSFRTTARDYMGTGALIGELGVLTKQRRAASLTCETDVELFHWNEVVMDKAVQMFADPYDSLEARLWRSYGIKVAAEFLHTQSAFTAWTGDRIRAHLEQGVVPVGNNFSTLDIPEVVTETVLIFGQIQNLQNGETLEAPALLPSTWNKVGPKERSVVVPRVLLLANEEGIQEVIEKGSLTDLHQCILHAPGVSMNLVDEEADDNQPTRQRLRSVMVQNISIMNRRRSTKENLAAINRASIK